MSHCRASGQLAGTSNVYYAYLLGLTPLGTMAHEYMQACQALGPRLRDSQVFAFDTWAKEYRGDLGIAHLHANFPGPLQLRLVLNQLVQYLTQQLFTRWCTLPLLPQLCLDGLGP